MFHSDVVSPPDGRHVLVYRGPHAGSAFVIARRLNGEWCDTDGRELRNGFVWMELPIKEALEAFSTQEH